MISTIRSLSRGRRSRVRHRREFHPQRSSKITMKPSGTTFGWQPMQHTSSRSSNWPVSTLSFRTRWAPDGMRLRHWVPVNASSVDQLPSVQEVSKSIREMAQDLTALRSAAVLEADYSGPVLFTGQASAEMFARVLAPNLSGQRLPLTDQQQAQTNRSELVDRLNRPVLPRFLSVFDDPTTQRIGNQELLGHYQVDDQGVPARRVSLIEQGVLKNFLMSRRPGKDMPQSNGHGRSVIPGRETAQIGNLFIQSNDGKSYDDLKQELIKMCREENLQYGILIKALDTDTRSPIG